MEKKKYTYEINSTKIYSADKLTVKELKTVLGLKSEYEVINLALTNLKNEISDDVAQLRKMKAEQKKVNEELRLKIANKVKEIF